MNIKNFVVCNIVLLCCMIAVHARPSKQKTFKIHNSTDFTVQLTANGIFCQNPLLYPGYGAIGLLPLNPEDGTYANPTGIQPAFLLLAQQEITVQMSDEWVAHPSTLIPDTGIDYRLVTYTAFVSGAMKDFMVADRMLYNITISDDGRTLNVHECPFDGCSS